jgi:hypothetical protein
MGATLRRPSRETTQFESCGGRILARRSLRQISAETRWIGVSSVKPISVKPKKGADGKALQKIFERLCEQDRKSLMDFAEFLAARVSEPASQKIQKIPEPKVTSRPKEESVVRAIKRLSNTYFMLDKAAMLNETSALMAQHIMHGRAAADVIDELETLFEQQYRKLLRADE